MCRWYSQCRNILACSNGDAPCKWEQQAAHQSQQREHTGDHAPKTPCHHAKLDKGSLLLAPPIASEPSLSCHPRLTPVNSATDCMHPVGMRLGGHMQRHGGAAAGRAAAFRVPARHKLQPLRQPHFLGVRSTYRFDPQKTTTLGAIESSHERIVVSFFLFWRQEPSAALCFASQGIHPEWTSPRETEPSPPRPSSRRCRSPPRASASTCSPPARPATCASTPSSRLASTAGSRYKCRLSRGMAPTGRRLGLGPFG